MKSKISSARVVGRFAGGWWGASLVGGNESFARLGESRRVGGW
jgi:hypothetical protein